MTEGPELRDIHLPADPSFWPLALGWWVMLIVISIIVFLLMWRIIRRRQLQFDGSVPQALARLEWLSKQDKMPDKQMIRQLSRLMRRTSMSLYGRDTVAGLAGSAWLQFLDSKYDQPAFTQGEGRALHNQPYQKQSDYDRQSLIRLVRRWIDMQRGSNV